MILPSSQDMPPEGAEPEGDDALWFNPPRRDPEGKHWFEQQHLRLFVCQKCDVRWTDDPREKVRCWNCGRFQARKYR